MPLARSGPAQPLGPQRSPFRQVPYADGQADPVVQWFEETYSYKDPAAILVIVVIERASAPPIAQVVGLVIPIGKLPLTIQLVTARHDRLL